MFVQVLLLAKAAGLVRLGTIAIDGTKVQGNASRHKAMSYGYMTQEVGRLGRRSISCSSGLRTSMPGTISANIAINGCIQGNAGQPIKTRSSPVGLRERQVLCGPHPDGRN